MPLLISNKSFSTMKGDFRTLLRKFCLESTILGLKYFYLYPDIVSRCFWLIIMFFVMSLATVLSWLLYARFAEMPTRVTIENQYEWVRGLPYPSITMCSPNQISLGFMKHFNKTLVDGNVTIDLEWVLPKLYGYYQYTDGNFTEDLMQLQSLLELNRYTVSEIMAAVPQRCEDFLKLCYFKGVRYPNCSTLFQPIITTVGFCCSFNNIYHYHNKRIELKKDFKPENVTEHGLANGLTVVTDYNPENAIDGTIKDAGGIIILYTDHTEFPTVDENTLVEPAVHTHHAIHATYTYCSDDVKALPYWGRNCYLDNEYVLPHFSGYHNSDCDLACYSVAVKDFCNCTLFYMPGVRTRDITCNLTRIACIMDVRDRMKEWLNAARCDCPRDCESRRYKVSMTIGNLDALPYMIVDKFDGIKFNESTSISSFYFPNLVYVKQKQETVMSMITFASNIGGVFGLCLGCSGISVLEVLFYMFTFVKHYVNGKLDKNKVKQIRSKRNR